MSQIEKRTRSEQTNKISIDFLISRSVWYRSCCSFYASLCTFCNRNRRIARSWRDFEESLPQLSTSGNHNPRPTPTVQNVPVLRKIEWVVIGSRISSTIFCSFLFVTRWPDSRCTWLRERNNLPYLYTRGKQIILIKKNFQHDNFNNSRVLY